MQDSVESKRSLYDTIQKIGCYDQTEFYSNFLSCWKCKDNINACGSLWQKKFYTFWQFRRNSIDLFLGPSFFFLVFFINRIQKIGCCDYSKFYSNFVSCGKHKDDINQCVSLRQKKLYTIWQFRRNSIDLFLGPYFIYIYDRIQQIGCYDQTEFYINFVSCGKRKDDINACG